VQRDSLVDALTEIAESRTAPFKSVELYLLVNGLAVAAAVPSEAEETGK